MNEITIEFLVLPSEQKLTAEEQSTVARFFQNKGITFVVQHNVDGGYTASAVGYGIHTQADTLPELREKIRDAVNCYFDETMERPQRIRLEVISRTSAEVKADLEALLPIQYRVGLVSWPGGFALGRYKIEGPSRPVLTLKRLHEPVLHKGKICGYCLDWWKEYTRQQLFVFRKTKFLPVTTEAEAQKIFKRLNDRIKRKEDQLFKSAQTVAPSIPDDEVGRSVVAAQMKYLKRLFPKTVKLCTEIKKEMDLAKRVGRPLNQERLAALNRASFYCYELEGKKLIHGNLPSLPADAWGYAQLIADAIKSKAKGEDAIDWELAANWIHKGYCDMSSREYAEAVAKAVNQPCTPRFMQLVIQRRKRLGLKTRRRRGPADNLGRFS